MCYPKREQFNLLMFSFRVTHTIFLQEKLWQHITYSRISCNILFGSPQPWTVHCLVTKKSADAQFSKSLYLPHNKSNQSEASNCCFVVDHKIGRARSLFFSHFCSHYFPCKLCLKNICWFHIFVMGQI